MAKKIDANPVKHVRAKRTKETSETKRSTKKTAQASSQSRCWLVKSEPDVFSIDDLAKSPNQTTFWDGVRNYQARNTLRDEMQIGDWVLFYHSNADPPGIAGICKVVRTGYPDHTAWDPSDPHYDPKSKKEDPTWYMVDLQLVEKFAEVLPLPELKKLEKLEGMVLLQRGSRLSVQPVSKSHFELIRRLGRKSR